MTRGMGTGASDHCVWSAPVRHVCRHPVHEPRGRDPASRDPATEARGFHIKSHLAVT